jgi:hypothetical protein
MRSDFKRPGASAANAADRASSNHQMKSNTEEPSNDRPTLVNVGRRKLVSFARRLTGLRPYRTRNAGGSSAEETAAGQYHQFFLEM